MKAVQGFGKTLVYTDGDNEYVQQDLAKGLYGTLTEIRGDGGGATHDGQRISFTLIDANVYEAIVRAVTKHSPSAWTRYAHVALGTPELQLPYHPKPKVKKKKVDQKVKRLAEAVLATPVDEHATRVFVDQLLENDDPHGKLLSLLPGLGKLSFDALANLVFAPNAVPYADPKTLKPALVELVRFSAWGTTWSPASSAGQFTGYKTNDYQGGVQPFVERARKKYAGMPELLAACNANQKAFQDRGDETDGNG